MAFFFPIFVRRGTGSTGPTVGSYNMYHDFFSAVRKKVEWVVVSSPSQIIDHTDVRLQDLE